METTYRRERIDRGVKVRTGSIYVVCSYRDMLYLVLPRLLPVIGLLLLPLLGGYWPKIFLYTCVYALLALGWDLLTLCGLVSLGQAFFFGVGAYLAGIFNLYLHCPVWLSMPLATFGGGCFCTILFSPALRLKGVFFVLITLMIPMVFGKSIEASEFIGGSHGLSYIYAFPVPLVHTYLTAVVLIVSLFGYRRLANSDWGLVLRAINNDDRAVLSAGISIFWYRIQTVFIASTLGAFAGAIMTHYFGFVGISAFSLDFSFLPLVAVAIGGSGSFSGAILGSFIIVPLSDLLRPLGGLRIVLYSLILIFCNVFLPGGITHRIERLYHQLERK